MCKRKRIKTDFGEIEIIHEPWIQRIEESQKRRKERGKLIMKDGLWADWLKKHVQS